MGLPRLLRLLRPGQIWWLRAVLPLDFVPRVVYAWLPVRLPRLLRLLRFGQTLCVFCLLAALGKVGCLRSLGRGCGWFATPCWIFGSLPPGFRALVGRMRGGAFSPGFGVHAPSLAFGVVAAVAASWSVLEALVVFLGLVLPYGVYMPSCWKVSPWLPGLLRPDRCWRLLVAVRRTGGLGVVVLGAVAGGLVRLLRLLGPSGLLALSWDLMVPGGFARVSGSWCSSSGCPAGNV